MTRMNPRYDIPWSEPGPGAFSSCGSIFIQSRDRLLPREASDTRVRRRFGTRGVRLYDPKRLIFISVPGR